MAINNGWWLTVFEWAATINECVACRWAIGVGLLTFRVFVRAALMRVCSVYVTTPLHNGLSTTPMEFRIVQEQAQGVKAATVRARVGVKGS